MDSEGGSNDATVNLVLRDCGRILDWHISEDIPLTLWVQLNEENKKKILFELGSAVENAVHIIDTDRRTITASLTVSVSNMGILYLSQWERIPVEKQDQMLSHNMLRFLRMRISEWIPRKWNIFVSNIVRNKKEHPDYLMLTSHHFFETDSGQTTSMLGKDRNSDLNNLIKLQINNENMGGAKELHPVHSLIAQPRQGKSLFLDVVSERFRQKGRFAVCITYNGESKYDEMDSFPESLAFHFWARVILAIVNSVHKDVIQWDIFKRSSFIPYLTIHHVFELINKCIPEFAEKPFFFAADEFSHVLVALRNNKKLSLLQKKEAISSITVPIYSNFCSLMFSGFETWSKVLFCTMSGRPVNSVWLLPVTQSERHHYKPLIDQLMDFYDLRPVSICSV